MNERINDLATQLAEELIKHEQQTEQAAEAEEVSLSDALLGAAAAAARMKLRMDVVDLVLKSELEIEDTDTLREVMETIYDFVADYKAKQ